MTDHEKKILIVGVGAFGTALAASIKNETNSVTLLARSGKNFGTLEEHPVLRFCHMETFDDFKTPFSFFDLIILAIPCQSLRSVCQWMRSKIKETNEDFTSKELHLVSAAKGIEQNTLLFPSQILQEFFGNSTVVGTLNGPSFAKEMLAGLPTCLVFASSNEAFSKSVPRILHSSHLRIYDSTDIVGVEVGGALKNIIAMVAGSVDGLKLGNNARAAVITRGLSEMAQVGVCLGADPMTFMGLSGLGDLILTCTGDLSRNRQFGFRLAHGESAEAILASQGGVVEGVATTQSAHQLCLKLGITSSILHMSYCVLYEGLPIQKAVHSLINKEQGGEFRWIKK